MKSFIFVKMFKQHVSLHQSTVTLVSLWFDNYNNYNVHDQLNTCCDILGLEPVGVFQTLNLVRPF